MSNQLAMVKKDVVDVVASRVKAFQESGELHFPTGYSPENAMKSAWLLLQDIKTGKNQGEKPVLEVCTKDSIANALLDMVVQGLNPMKKQGYFLPYGQTLTFQRSYFGTMAVTKRVTGAKSIDAMTIHEGDEVNYEIKDGRIINLTHKQSFGNMDKAIIGAYCTIVEKDGSIYTELMTKEQIDKSWKQSKNNASADYSVHSKFPGEMTKRTVIARACKKFMNSSDDSSILFNLVEENDDRVAEAQVRQEIEENGNSIDLDFEEVLVEGPVTSDGRSVDPETAEIFTEPPASVQNADPEDDAGF